MKNVLFALICVLAFGLESTADPISGRDLIPISLVMNDGQVKKGKVKDNFNPNKKFDLILDNGSTEEIDNENVKELSIEREGATPIVYENVHYYKSIRRSDIAKKPTFMMVLMRGPLTIYFDSPVQYTSGGAGNGSYSSYSNFYGIREGEPAASILSAVVSGQVNPNSVFKNAAPDYFSDYPALAAKIKNKTYTYADIMTVAIEYTEWKNSK